MASLTVPGGGASSTAQIATSTAAGTVKPGYGLSVLSDGTLSAPNIAPFKTVLSLPSGDGSPAAGPINAAIASAINQGLNALYLAPAALTIEAPIVNPGNFDLIGLGRHVPQGVAGPITAGKHLPWGGGVQLASTLNATYPILSVPGTTDGSGSTNGFIFNPGFINLSVYGAVQSSQVTRSGGPGRMIDIRNAYRLRLEQIYGGNDFHQILYLNNVWDSYIYELAGNSCGFSDPHATTDNATVQGYTGRSFMQIETLIGRSLGVPMIEIFSPNTNGADVSNNIRIRDVHLESNGTNGVPLMVHGGNGVMITIDGAKIECAEGNVPMIVICDQSGFRYEGWLYGCGNGTSPAAFGGVNYDAWNKTTNPGLILACNCYGPQFNVTIGYSHGGAPLQAFAHFVNTENPKIEADCTDGLQMLTPAGAAGLIFDNCSNVSAARTRFYAPSYVKAISGANTTERANNNSTTVA